MSGRRYLTAAAAVVLCAWCGWVSGFHRSTTPALVTWSISTVAVVVVNLLLVRGRQGKRPGLRLAVTALPWPRPGRGGARRALLGVSPWIILVLVVLAWEILGIDTGSHEPHLTVSALTQAYRPLNAAFLLVWIAVGLGYGVARARAPVDRRAEPDQRKEVPGAYSLVGGPTVLPRMGIPALLLPTSRAIGVVFWLGVVTTAVILDSVGRRSDGRLANIEELLRFITTSPVANALLIIAWGYAGYHSFGN
jgi:hypothetical protein